MAASMHTRLHEARCAAESEALLSASHTFNQWRYNSLKVRVMKGRARLAATTPAQALFSRQLQDVLSSMSKEERAMQACCGIGLRTPTSHPLLQQRIAAQDATIAQLQAALAANPQSEAAMLQHSVQTLTARCQQLQAQLQATTTELHDTRRLLQLQSAPPHSPTNITANTQHPNTQHPNTQHASTTEHDGADTHTSSLLVGSVGVGSVPKATDMGRHDAPQPPESCAEGGLQGRTQEVSVLQKQLDSALITIEQLRMQLETQAAAGRHPSPPTWAHTLERVEQHMCDRYWLFGSVFSLVLFFHWCCLSTFHWCCFFTGAVFSVVLLISPFPTIVSTCRSVMLQQQALHLTSDSSLTQSTPLQHNPLPPLTTPNIDHATQAATRPSHARSLHSLLHFKRKVRPTHCCSLSCVVVQQCALLCAIITRYMFPHQCRCGSTGCCWLGGGWS